MAFDGPLPGIPESEIVEVAELPAHLAGAQRLGASIEARPGALLFGVAGIARYLISDGKTVAVEAATGGDRDAATLFLHGSARGVLIHQRGELALEAATLVGPDRRCVAISSYSGVGKSTVAAALCLRGWKLVADDITRIAWNGRRAIAWPSHEALKLWRDACEKLGIEADAHACARAGMQKYVVPMPAADAPVPVDMVVKLRLGPRASCALIRGPARLALLSECTFRQRLLPPLGRAAEHAFMVARVDETCRVVTLTGARSAPPEELASAIVAAAR